MSDTLLPHNATAQEVALDSATARLGAVPVPINDVWDPQACPSSLLPWLAWAVSVDRWDPTLSDDQKRTLIATSAALHQRKGTRSAIENALSGLGYSSLMIEWWEETPKAAPYTFAVRLEIDQVPVPTQGVYAVIAGVIDTAKNARSHFDGLELRGLSSAGIFVAAREFSRDVVFIDAEPV